MENETNSIETLLKKTGDYLEAKVELMKLKAVDKATAVTSSMLSSVILIVIVFLMLTTLNIGIAVWLGDLLGEVYYGFFLVSAFYLLVAVLLYLFRSKWMKKPFRDILVRKMLD